MNANKVTLHGDYRFCVRGKFVSRKINTKVTISYDYNKIDGFRVGLDICRPLCFAIVHTLFHNQQDLIWTNQELSRLEEPFLQRVSRYMSSQSISQL